MDAERRYSEEEVARILDRATEVDSGERGHGPGSEMGLTLGELHEIGREVGIPADVITNAARSLDRPAVAAEPTHDRHYLGARVGVGRSMQLPRTLTDAEWHRLVLDLRDTFDAKGKISEEGAFRQWTNSNLQALVEPTEDGSRVRLRTMKGSGRMLMTMGMAFMGASAFTFVMSIIGASGSDGLSDAITFGAVGAGLYTWARVTLPGWARTRERQMEEILARLQAAMKRVGPGGDPDAESG